MQRRRHADRVRRELEGHLEALVRAGVEDGLAPEEARRRARLAFGSIDLAAEECRDGRRGAWLFDVGRDLQHAVRLMRRAPGFTVFAIATLAGGIGACTAVFSVVYALLLAALPVARPDQLVALGHGRADRGGGAAFPRRFVRELDDERAVLQAVVARGGVERLTVGLEGGGEPAVGELVSGNFFAALGLTPAAGRFFTADDDRVAGAHPVVVLGHAYWQRRFAGDPAVVGRTLVVSGTPMTIVGVSPRGFDGLDPGQRVDLRAPLAMQGPVRGGRASAAPRPAVPGPAVPAARPDSWELQVVARLADGVAPVPAQQAIDAAFQRYLRAAGETGAGAITVTSAATGAGRTRARVQTMLRVLMAMALAVLGVACANLAMLVTARSAARTDEWAVRAALGAGTVRLARQLVTESVLLAACGALVGAAVAWGGASWLAQLVSGSGSILVVSAAPRPAVIALHAAAAIAAGLGLALGAVLRLRRGGSGPGHGADTRTVTAARHRGLIAGQVALSTIVLVGAALFVRSIQALRATDLGLRPDHLLLAALDPKTAGRADSEVVPFYRGVRERLLAMPGVSAVSFSTVRALANGRWSDAVRIEGRPLDPSARSLRDAVGPDYFRTLGIGVVAGREFDDADDVAAAKVAIVNQAFVRTFLPDVEPIGQVIGSGTAAHAIVGVVRDARQVHVREPPAPTWYVPYEQRQGLKHLDVIVRATADPEGLVGDVRRAIAAVDPRAALFEVRTQTAQLDELIAGERTLARLATICAGAAATIAAIGLHGLLALVVAQRRREIGLRVALGATAPSVVLAIAGDVARSAAAGLAAGLVGAALLGQQVRAMLYGVQPGDAPSFAVAAVVMGVAAAAGAAWPLVRAARIDPAIVLRE